ncbi:MAG: hypothetical protein WAN69_19835 [Candidatus Korobacteraceae bacterium]|jgi:hypothetical protein
MKTIKYELKYCEGCGTLKLRPVNSTNHSCVLCERMLARFRFPQRVERKMPGGLPPQIAGVAPAGRLQ